jgi:hypothetical protein
MNETSRGSGGGGSTRGDPPIGGYPPPSSSTTPSSSAPAVISTAATSTTATTSSTSSDLPSLSASLSGDLDGLGEGLSLTRLLAGDSNSWDFSDPLGSAAAAASQSQGSYRPWEADLATSTASTMSDTSTSGTFTTLISVSTAPPNVLAPPSPAMPRHQPHPHHAFYQPHPHHAAYIDQRLPSFNSQFQEVPPPGYPGATPGHAHYPLVPPPVQAREIPNIQQQFLDERHIQSQHHHSLGLYGHPAHTLAQPRPHFPPTSRLAAHITSPQSIVARKSHPHEIPRSHHLGHHHAPSSEMTAVLTAVEAHPTLAAQLRKKTARAGSLEGSESDRSSMTADTPGQVAAISSTDPTPESLAGLADSFKPHIGGLGVTSMQHPTPSIDDDYDKPTKKKRKRCGECTGCQRKDNCGECAPCRNDKSHQICKLRRCDRLTEKKPRKPNVS